MIKSVEQLSHGYTNSTFRDGPEVVKHYEGPDSGQRRQRERDVLAALQPHLPVPRVLPSGHGELRMSFVEGRHGQELLDEGHAADVLRACGETLRTLHAVEPTRVLAASPAPRGAVLVHGDYGPNNLLFDPVTWRVTAVLDWEWAHVGQRVEDLAWAEWITRMHHPLEVAALPALFDGYGRTLPWLQRQEAMLARCRSLLNFAVCWDRAGPGRALWEQRLALTASWTE